MIVTGLVPGTDNGIRAVNLLDRELKPERPGGYPLFTRPKDVIFIDTRFQRG